MISSRREPRKSSSSMTLGSDSTHYTLSTEDNKGSNSLVSESINAPISSTTTTTTTTTGSISGTSLEFPNKSTTTTTAPVNVTSLSNNSTIPSIAIGTGTGKDSTMTSPLTAIPLENQTPSYNFSRLDNNNEDLSIFSVAYQNAAQMIPSLTPPPLPPREISDNLSIKSGSLVGEPTISLSQPSTPIRSKTLTRKPPPPSKSPLLQANSSNQHIKDL